MVLVNVDYISGKELETIGLVKGSTVQTKHFGKDIMASFKSFVGGEIKVYSEMMDNARVLATRRMVDEATRAGADAVVGVRFETAAIMENAAEVIAYGTAVKFK